MSASAPIIIDAASNNREATIDIARAIDELLDPSVPDDWQGATAIERRRGQLRTVAGEAAQTMLEMLTAGVDALRREDIAVDANAAAMAALHGGIRVYRRNTQLLDALELVRAAKPPGGGIAELVVRLLERLQAEMLPEQLRRL
jgi:hypothetical protein